MILMLFSAAAARGGFERTDAGGRAFGLGGAYTASGRDAWCVFYNPAGLAGIPRPEAGFFLSPRPFGFSELSYMAAAGAVPTAAGVVAIAGSRYGYAFYREESMTLALAVRTGFGDVGATLSRNAVTIDRYGSASAFAVSAGYCCELERTLRIGIRVRNLNAPVLGSSEEPLRGSAAIGIAYAPVPSFLLSADLLKEFAVEPAFRAGAEIVLTDAFVVRVGATDQPSEFHGGIGIRQGFVSFDYAFSLHEDLGLTHACSLSVRWGGGSDE